MARTAARRQPSAGGESPAKRDAILAAALDLFCEHGFDATPVPAIAERAGVGSGTIYRYFESKEALVNTIYQQWKHEMKRVLVDSGQPGEDTRAEFHRWWTGLWRFATDHPRALAFLEMHHHQPYLDAASRAAGEELAEGARAFVRRAQRTGSVRRTDPDTLTAMVFGAFTGLVKSASAQGARITQHRIAETEEYVWAMLRAEPRQLSA